MSLESSSSSSEILARQMLIFDRIIPVAEMVERIESVSKQDILTIAERIFSSTPSYTLVGDIDGHPDYTQIQTALKR